MKRSAFKDHFSRTAAGYARFRPSYPDALFAYLASLCRETRTAWDCGAGSGQASAGLARHVRLVVASDASDEQIARARRHPRVAYFVGRAEASGLAPRSIDLVASGQAAHWYDLEAFVAEVARTLRPAGIVALWCYGLHEVSDAIDPLLRRLYRDILGPYWPDERRLVDAGYGTIPFPFEEIEPPRFVMEAEWDLGRLLGYLGTWSAAWRYRESRGEDAVSLIGAELRSVWGPPETRKRIRWPLSMRVGRLIHDPGDKPGTR